MINYIIGKITYVGTKFILLESNLVGYYINVVKPEQFEVNTNKRIYVAEIIKMNNRNNLTHEYYGFVDLDSKYLFTTLQTVPNIGPKTALSILKNDPKKVMQYIRSGSYEDLSCLPGISLQLAQAICNNLTKTITAKAKTEGLISEEKSSNESNLGDFSINEVSGALLKLGYQKPDIEYAINKLSTENQEKITDVSDALSICIQLIYQRNHNETSNNVAS